MGPPLSGQYLKNKAGGGSPLRFAPSNAIQSYGIQSRDSRAKGIIIMKKVALISSAMRAIMRFRHLLTHPETCTTVAHNAAVTAKPGPARSQIAQQRSKSVRR